MTATGKVVCIIQCRMSSSRLPRKAMLDLCGKSLIERVIARCRQSAAIDELVVATSTQPEDELIELVCSRNNVRCFRGDLADVRSRYLRLARSLAADIVVRVTADNPMTEPVYIDQLVEYVRKHPDVAYAIMDKKLIPLGTGSEVFRAWALFESAARFAELEDLEHVTPSVRKAYPVAELTPPEELLLEGDSVGIDTFEDYFQVYRIFATYGDDRNILRNHIRDRRRA